MGEIWAILPVKAFDRAKSRLAPALAAAQRKKIAKLMAIDVLGQLTCTRKIDCILVVGQGPEQERLARRFDCEYENDDPKLDVSGNLTRIASKSEFQAASILMLVAADMPQLCSEDLSRVLGTHKKGVTICRAVRDGGTNLFVATMPQHVEFSFGAGSAKRHMLVAQSAGQSVRVLDDHAFQYDIDTPDDLKWLCRQSSSCETVKFLRESFTYENNVCRSA